MSIASETTDEEKSFIGEEEQERINIGVSVPFTSSFCVFKTRKIIALHRRTQ